MTAEHIKASAKKKRTVSLKGLGFCYMTLFLIILFFKSSSAASEWVSAGLRICAVRLIPSLFPFMVLSSLAVSSGAGRLVPKAVQRLFWLIFGVGSDGTSAIVLGWLCGFPVGAKCAGDLYGTARIDADEYKRIVCISSTPSPAFLIGAVGKGMLNSTPMGVCLYVISIVSSVTVGIVLGRRSQKDSSGSPVAQGKRIGFAEAFTRAVSESAVGMLNICAFVVFFSAFLGVLENALSPIGLSNTVSSIIFGFFELTSGLSRISSLTDSSVFCLCALAVGWSGLSVHFQTVSVCSGKPFSLSSYLLTHLLRSVICPILAMALMFFGVF